MEVQRINDPAELPSEHDLWLASQGLGYEEDLWLEEEESCF